ncbi:hypothetical protein D1BOALGB6SA_6241 [Olavius sp. associated proteobacterium Delta 1]|nr:hypothetical protein D1BOALGB6SA_6241 [Olavius sp. associated proteobacterium Delta 1]
MTRFGIFGVFNAIILGMKPSPAKYKMTKVKEFYLFKMAGSHNFSSF